VIGIGGNVAGEAISRGLNASGETKFADTDAATRDIAAGVVGAVAGAGADKIVKVATAGAAQQAAKQAAASLTRARAGSYAAQRSVAGHAAKVARIDNGVKIVATVVGENASQATPALKKKIDDVVKPR
jgi:hypothetical protein